MNGNWGTSGLAAENKGRGNYRVNFLMQPKILDVQMFEQVS